jgi:hypothetical protein
MEDREIEEVQFEGKTWITPDFSIEDVNSTKSGTWGTQQEDAFYHT